METKVLTMEEVAETDDVGMTFPFVCGGVQELIERKRTEKPLEIEFFFDGAWKAWKTFSLEDEFEKVHDFIADDYDPTDEDEQYYMERSIKFFSELKKASEYWLNKLQELNVTPE